MNTDFSALELAPALLQSLAENGFTVPTPIQAQAIPLVLQGRDVMGGAQTGTGKTAAFGLPVLHRLLESVDLTQRNRKPQVLILVPTRELAVQVHDNLMTYAKHTKLRMAVLFGGAGMIPQEQALRRGVDVLVATPGRLIDHMERGTAQLGEVRTVVLDEADRMLDMGFLPSMKRVLGRIRKSRQTLLFSATFETRIKQLALEFMIDPVQVQVAAQNTIAETIAHKAHPVDAAQKRDLLVELLARRFKDQAIVFAKTKHGCNRLAEYLEEAGLPALAIHGNMSQAQRQKALNEFKAGKVRLLVATDVAARGLDIPNLPLVINYDLPTVAEDYVHRIGRTGRNGSTGEALSLLAPEEGGLLRQIQEVLKAPVEMEIVPGFEPSRPVQLNAPIPKQPQRQGRAARPKHATAGKQRKPQGHTAQPRKGGGKTGSRNRRGSGSGFSKS